jgi:exosortase A-associated hydrolase 1
MNYTEEAVRIHCEGQSLTGIQARPEIPMATGVIVLVGGPQYRVGSHRQFVLLSRTLAEAGYAVLRFDFRGMGDSDGSLNQFTCVSADLEAALLNFKNDVPEIKTIVLWGLCDGASAALLYCYEKSDSKISGLCLLNPWIRSPESLAQMQIKHYYAQRLLEKDFWLKLMSGKVSPSALLDLTKKLIVKLLPKHASPLAEKTFQQKMAHAWKNYEGKILLMLSEEDYVAKEFVVHADTDPSWRGLLQMTQLTRHDLKQSDHTLSSIPSRLHAEQLTLKWLSEFDELMVGSPEKMAPIHA